MKHILRTGEFIQPHGSTLGRLSVSAQVEQIVVLGGGGGGGGDGDTRRGENQVMKKWRDGTERRKKGIRVSERERELQEELLITLRSPKAGLEELPHRPLGKSSHA